jgi:hypothetical protein
MHDNKKISLPAPYVPFSPPKKFQFYPPKVRFLFIEVFQYRKTRVFNRLKLRFVFTEVFFNGINGNLGGEKETWGVGREIFRQQLVSKEQNFLKFCFHFS